MMYSAFSQWVGGDETPKLSSNKHFLAPKPCWNTRHVHSYSDFEEWKPFKKHMFFLDLWIKNITGVFGVMWNLPRAHLRPSRAPLDTTPGVFSRHLWPPGDAQHTNRVESTGHAQSPFRQNRGRDYAARELIAVKFWASFTHSEAHMEPTRSPELRCNPDLRRRHTTK